MARDQDEEVDGGMKGIVVGGEDGKHAHRSGGDECASRAQADIESGDEFWEAVHRLSALQLFHTHVNFSPASKHDPD